MLEGNEGYKGEIKQGKGRWGYWGGGTGISAGCSFKYGCQGRGYLSGLEKVRTLAVWLSRRITL